MLKKLAFAAFAAALALATRAPSVYAQKALVYCPIGVDAAGCDRVVAALQTRFPEGVDRGYDGTGGTVDLKKADLQHYDVFVVPSLADAGGKKPYAVLRAVAPRLKMAITGRVAVYSGSPDQGTGNRPDKDLLVQNLAKWASDGHSRKTGLVGLVALLDLSEDVSARYSWVREISAADVSADAEIQAFNSVNPVTDHGRSVLAPGGKPTEFANMASYGLHIGSKAAARTLVAAVAGTDSHQSVLIMFTTAEDKNGRSAAGGASNSVSSSDKLTFGDPSRSIAAGGASASASASAVGGPTITTDKPDYLPGDTVMFSGTGWTAGDTIVITVHEDPTWSFPDRQFTAIANGSGEFTNRDMIVNVQDFGATFTATAVANPSGLVAQTSFTDGRVVNTTGTTLNGGTSVSVLPLTSINAVVSVTTTNAGGNQWRSTRWSIASSPPGANDGVCVNTPDHSGANTFSEAFSIAAPAAVGTYNTYFIAYQDDTCSTGASSVTTLSGSVVVNLGPLAGFKVTNTSGSNIGTQTAGTAFDIKVTAVDVGGNTISSFDGSNNKVTISSTGTLSAGSGPTAAFTNGVLAAHSVNFSNAGSFTITATRFNGGSESGTSNAFTVSAPACTAPTITTQPANQTPVAFTPASFTVVAGGTASLGYQWRKGGVNISTATNATANTSTLTISPATSADAGSYDVVVTNGCGTLTSNPATLTITKVTPAFTNLTAPQTLTFGAASVAVGGTIKSGTNIPSGNVAVTLNGVTQQAAINSSTGAFTTTFTTTTLPASATAYAVTYGFTADNDFNGVSDNTTTTVTVNKASTSVGSITASASTYGGTTDASATVTPAVAGSVAFFINGSATPVPATAYDAATGLATLTTYTHGLNASNTAYSVRAVFTSSNANYSGNEATNSAALLVSKSSQSITFGQPTTPAVFGTSFAVAPTASSSLAVSVAASGGCTISAGTVTMTSGTTDCTLTATQAGDNNYNPATDVVRTVAASKASQTITFAQPTTPAAFGTTFAVSPTSSSLLTVSVAASGGCSITTGTVTMTSGTTACVLTATQLGNDNYSAASEVVRTVNATKASQTITFAQPATPAVFGSSFSVAPTSSSLLSVSVAATGACSISSGTVTMTSGTGDCTLTATQSGNDNYSGATEVVRTVAASKASQTITFAQPTSPAVFGTSFSVAPTSNSSLAVSVGATGGCSISSGTVTMTSGTTDCTLTASQAGDVNYNAATEVVRTVVAGKANQSITFAQPTSPATFGSTFAVAPTTTSGLTVSVGASGGCSISAGSVTMTSGTTACVLTATQTGNDNYNAAAPVERTVAAAKAAQSIEFAQPTTPAVFGSSFSVAPTSSSLLLVSVAATGACSISSGTVTMTSGTGDCTLTATQTGNNNYDAANNVVRTVAASKASQTITFAQPTSPAIFGTSFSVAPTSGSGLAVSVGATGGCSISSGTVTMTSGTTDCTLTASQAGNANYNAATDVMRTVAAAKASQTITFAQPTTPATFGSSFPVAPTTTSGLTVNVGASGGCSISGGTVTMTSGTTACVLTATQTGDNNYSAATEVVRTVAASKASQSITFAQPTSPAVFGTSFSVTPTSSSDLPVSIGVSGGCSISAGSVTMTSGTTACVLTANQTGNDNYNAAAPVERTVAAAKAAQSIEFTQPTTPAVFGTTFSVAPSASSLLNVNVAASGGCSISSGTVTMTSGTTACVLTATQTGDNNYNPATEVVRTVAASKASQSITFAQPTSPAVFGTSFSVAPTASSQLAVTMGATGGCSINNGSVTMTSGTTDCTLTATQSGDANYNAATEVVRTVVAAKASQSITFAQPTSPATFGSTFAIAPTASSGLPVVVGASGGCSVDAGTVTMTSGTTNCVLTATQAGDGNYNAAAQVVRTVVANKANQTITFGQPTTPAVFGTTFTVAPTATSGLTVGIVATGGCSISSGTVSMTSGTTACVLTASQAGNDNYNPATDVVRTVAASKASQSITFTQPTTPAVFGTSFAVAPTASSSLAVSVAASGGCTISAGTVTMTSGTTDCTLTATQAGDNNYSPAPELVRTVAASKATQTITFAQPTTPATFGTTFAVAPTASSGLTVNVGAAGGCSIAAGTVTMTSGTTDCTLTATQAGDANYSSAAQVVRTVVASKASQTITFAQPVSSAVFGTTFSISPTVSSPLTVGVAATGGCSLNNGTVTMTSGTTSCVLTATQAGNDNYAAAIPVVRTVAATKAATPTLTLGASPNPVQVSDHVILTPGASSSLGTPTGTFSLTFGSLGVVASGVAPGAGFNYTIPNGTTPNIYTVTANFANDPNYADGSTSAQVTVTPENGYVKYVGTQWIATNSQGQATILLTAFVSDDPDGSPGDLRYAKVTFVDRGASNAAIGSCKDVRIDIADAFNPTQGTATCSYTVTLGKTEDNRTIQVGTQVKYSHGADRADDDVLVIVVKAPPGSISGGGQVIGDNAVSMYAGTVSPVSSFAFNVTFNKSMTSLQGNASVKFTVGTKTYLAKGNSLTNLSVGGPTGTALVAAFTSKASIQDAVTGASIDGNATIQLSLFDGGDAVGRDDRIAITVFGKNGGVIYSNKWSITAGTTGEQTLGNGNISVVPNP